ncbi:MAG TPA: response regulator [Pseudolabrys sp.]|nr:response regulator [Pseudolabrys sp.]
MPLFHAADTWLRVSVDRPACPHCGWVMWLSQIEPEKPGYDKRIFECARCELTQQRVVAIDQPESDTGS